MKALDIIRRAFASAFRSRLRTTLTVLAIIIGAFTLTLTNAVGAGVNRFMTETVATVGAEDLLVVTRIDDREPEASGPHVFNPDRAVVNDSPMASAMAPSALALTDADIETIAAIPGVLTVEPAVLSSIDFVQVAGSQPFEASLGRFFPGMHVELAAGSAPNPDSTSPEIVLPIEYAEALGFATPEAGLGSTVTIGLTDITGGSVTTEATLVGFREAGLIGGDDAIGNETLSATIAELQSYGRSTDAAETYMAAFVTFDPSASASEITAMRDAFTDHGYATTTIEDALGAVTSVIDGIVLVLSAFAVIALIAASIGIINTLFMAVQERTREVGLMKAMGLSSSKVFALFSTEAVVLGLLGSVIGVVLAIIVGQVTSATLAATVLSALPGLNLFVFAPATVLAVVLGVMAVAFVAGTLPALRAAKQDPINSLRYE